MPNCQINFRYRAHNPLVCALVMPSYAMNDIPPFNLSAAGILVSWQGNTWKQHSHTFYSEEPPHTHCPLCSRTLWLCMVTVLLPQGSTFYSKLLSWCHVETPTNTSLPRHVRLDIISLMIHSVTNTPPDRVRYLPALIWY